MNTLVIYDSKYGNTEKVAQAIADTLQTRWPVRIVSAEKARAIPFEYVEFMIVGGPTQNHKASPDLQHLLDSLAIGAVTGKPVAVFDTRYHMNALLSGSAAKALGKKLEKSGAWLVLPPESFFVTDSTGPLEEGELERAMVWAGRLFEKLELQKVH